MLGYGLGLGLATLNAFANVEMSHEWSTLRPQSNIGMPPHHCLLVPVSPLPVTLPCLVCPTHLADKGGAGLSVYTSPIHQNEDGEEEKQTST
jgi:hypothetical protein